MNIIVCVKPVPDPSIIALDPIHENGIDEDDLVYMINPSDFIAVEEAVGLKSQESEGRVTLLTVAPPSRKRLLQRCSAVGADDIILAWDKAFHGSDGYATGVILAKAITSMKFDLVLCGNRSEDTQSGQVGYILADILDMPVVPRVTHIETTAKNNTLIVEKRREGGKRERIEVELPALLTIEQSMAESRYASLPSLMSAFEKEIIQYNMIDHGLSPADVGKSGSRTQIVEMRLPRPRPKKLFIPPSSFSAAERMQLVITGGVKEKKQEVFEGLPEDLSLKLVQYLKQICILPSVEPNRK